MTKDNYQAIIPQLQLAPKAIADIQAAAQAGLMVTTHQKRIHVNGYTGEGYIILNERGNGAYLINGGLYGGMLILKALFKWIWLYTRGIASLGSLIGGLASMFGEAARFMALLSYIVTLAKIATSCPPKDQTSIIVDITALTVFALYGAFVATTILAPLTAFAVVVFGGFLTTSISSSYLKVRSCK